MSQSWCDRRDRQGCGWWHYFLVRRIFLVSVPGSKQWLGCSYFVSFSLDKRIVKNCNVTLRAREENNPTAVLKTFDICVAVNHDDFVSCPLRRKSWFVYFGISYKGMRQNKCVFTRGQWSTSQSCFTVDFHSLSGWLLRLFFTRSIHMINDRFFNLIFQGRPFNLVFFS